MKRFPHIALALLIVSTVLFVNPIVALADEEKGGHELEMEVNGYHVSLSSENEWVKGANTVVVTLTDGMGMPVYAYHDDAHVRDGQFCLQNSG